jgi:predicted nucleotidyltransferase
MTRAGPLDLLGTIGHGHTYEDLLGETIRLEIGKGLQVRVLKLEMLIKVKEETAGEKDKAALLILRRTLEERTAS